MYRNARKSRVICALSLCEECAHVARGNEPFSNLERSVAGGGTAKASLESAGTGHLRAAKRAWPVGSAIYWLFLWALAPWD